MKKAVILLGIMVMGTQLMANNRVQKLLNEARDDYYREQREQRAQSSSLGDMGTTVDNGDVFIDDGYVENTPLGRLESNVEKAKIKADFYERVVRSVAREEIELKNYNEVLGNKKTKYKKIPKVKGMGK